MRVIVDQDKCIAAGQCVAAADAVFDQRDDDGVVVLLDETPPADLTADVEEAVRICPAAAIRIEN